MPPTTVSADREIYRRSPIVEAAIDIRCTNRPTFTISEINRLAGELSSTFQPDGEAVEHVEELLPDGGRRTTIRTLGLILQRERDSLTNLQLQTEGFTYSHMAPYDRWEPFRDEAKELWSRYAELAEPQIVTRIGVRFINRIVVGEKIDDLSPYLRIYPITPWRLQTPPSGFTLQLRTSTQDDMALIMNVATVRGTDPSTVGLLLDLDAFALAELAPDSDSIWNLVERLHVKVEEAFEDSITDVVRDLIR
jgi:uncharacterized protein (TIGR04255 family)